MLHSYHAYFYAGVIVGLSLVEQYPETAGEAAEEIAEPNAAYRVSRILEPFLERVLSEEAWQETYQQMVRRLYAEWWENAERSSDAQRLEMVRLALLADQQEIAAVVGDAIAINWYNNARYVEDMELCQQILEKFEDYRILGSIAKAEAVLGYVEEAIAHYQQALDRCPEDSLGDKSATLNNMALVIAQQGDIERALQLWEASLDIHERINDVQGKAATLNNMAYVFGEQGDRAQQLTLNLQAAAAFSQARAYGDLFTVLCNLGVAAEENSTAYLAQAIWLMLRIQAPLTDAITLLNVLYQRIEKGDPLEALLGTTAFFLCQSRGENHPNIEQLQNQSLNILAGAATEQGASIESMEDLQSWMQNQQLTDSSIFLPQLNGHLATLIGDTWAFDPAPLQGE